LCVVYLYKKPCTYIIYQKSIFAKNWEVNTPLFLKRFVLWFLNFFYYLPFTQLFSSGNVYNSGQGL
jgi:hypothetical protein